MIRPPKQSLRFKLRHYPLSRPDWHPLAIKLEYFPYPADQRPSVLLLYEFEPAEVVALREAIAEIGKSEPGRVLQIDELPGVVAIDGCTLAATIEHSAEGGGSMSRDQKAFQWLIGDWPTVSGLLEPFCEPGLTNAFQFLSDAAGPVELIISTTRGW
jgi:hypothetical protein